ncbi:helix-turn-helix domain-containing protein [Clostridiaceae bacterium 35-E11]
MKLANFLKRNHITLISNFDDDSILSKEFECISIVTFPGNLFWVQNNDLVFISPDLLSHEDLLNILKNLISKKVLGCCIICDDDFKLMNAETITLCHQNNLLLFQLQKEHDFEVIWLEILSSIIHQDHLLPFFQQQLKNNIICLMSIHQLSEKNLTYLLSFFLYREIYLLSKQFNLLCHDNPMQSKLLHDLPLKKWSQELSTWHTDESQFFEPMVIDFNARNYYCFPLKSHKNILGYLCIEKSHPLWGELNTYFIAEILPNFILCMIDKSKNELTYRKPIEEYLQSILYGLFTDENTLKRETAYFHFEYYLNRYVWILQIEPLHTKDYRRETQIPHAILYKAKNVVEQIFCRNIFLVEKSQIVSIHVKDDEPNEKVLSKFDMLLNDLELQCPEYSFRIGVSRAYADVYRLKYAYEDALFSLTIGKMLFSVTKKVFCYDDLLIYHFLYQQMDNPILQRLYVNTVQKITIHDIEKQDSLYETLSELINCDFNVKETYENLYIHRNTLYQRMKKIEKIIGLSIKSSETKLLLQLGLKLDHIHRILRKPIEQD